MHEESTITLSESMQMYLITIARLWGDRQPVPLSRLADVFSITPVSVNEMCRKLQDNGLVNYQPYKGAMLTAEGKEKADYIIRRHNLWEEFLIKKLGFEYGAAHDMACQLEHTTPDVLEERLAAYLHDPSFTAPDDLIRGESFSPVQLEIRLDQLTAGQKGKILRYEFENNTQAFLQKAGFQRGVHISILATSDDGMLILLDKAKTVSLSRGLAHAIMVISDQPNEVDRQDDLPGIPNSPKQMEATGMNHPIDYDIQEKPVVQMALNKLRVGQRGIVVGVSGQAQLKQRMMDMGLVPGTEVQVVRVAPLGNPIEFMVKGYHLSLRKNESSQIMVEVIG